MNCGEHFFLRFAVNFARVISFAVFSSLVNTGKKTFFLEPDSPRREAHGGLTRFNHSSRCNGFDFLFLPLLILNFFFCYS